MNQPSKTFKDLIVWQKAHALVLAVYGYSKRFPREEVYGLTSQIRRSAVSVAANIAEGFKKRSKKEKLRYLDISQSSLEETRYYLILSEDLEYGGTGDLMESLEEVSRILGSYSRAVQRGSSSK